MRTYLNGRMMFRKGGRFSKPPTLQQMGYDVVCKPMICGKCGYGAAGEWLPVLRTGICPKCGNQENHKEFERVTIDE